MTVKVLPLVVLCCAAGVVGALATALLRHDPLPPPATTAAASTADVDALRTELAELARRLAALEHAVPASIAPVRGDANALPVHVTGGGAAADRRDPAWYLDQYVRSFADDSQGFEYYRLAVEAHVVELAGAIAVLVRDAGRPVPLRMSLAQMLGKRRFDEAGDVIDALLAAVRPPSPEPLALRALEALARIRSVHALPGLEVAIAQLREPSVRDRALALLVELAGDGANTVLLRLFLQARDDELRIALLAHLNGAEAIAAHELLRAAATGEQPVRLAAAKKLSDYDTREIDALHAWWQPQEKDPQVLAALGGTGQAADAAGWSARQATGAPDADPSRDDPKAWASKSGDMGLQWLQLTYATPVRANGVRIFEVNAPGAVAEVRARGDDGAWTTLWRGVANGNGQPLVLTFPLTAFPVRTIRLVLDTDRTPGWNEIDAVELLGPGGGQWATRATASSTYASQVAGAQREGTALQFLQHQETLRGAKWTTVDRR